MLSKSKSLLEIKKELKEYLNNKSVYDVILFGSFVKGKVMPSDIDVAVICDEKLDEINGYHISFIKPLDFFKEIPSLINTIFREGYSLKNNKSFCEQYGFRNKVMYIYELSGLSDSEKVRIVNFLRGNKSGKGMIAEKECEWISNASFICSIQNDNLFEQFFLTNKVKFRKYNLLMH